MYIGLFSFGKPFSFLICYLVVAVQMYSYWNYWFNVGFFYSAVFVKICLDIFNVRICINLRFVSQYSFLNPSMLEILF